MPATLCPHCGAKTEVADGWQAVACPVCYTAFRPNDEGEANSSEDLIEYARSECRDPASLLSILGVLTALLGFIAVLIAVMRVFRWLNAPTAMGLSSDVGIIVYIAVGLSVILSGGFQAYAARLMHRAEHYPICVIACVVALFNPCCVGILLGINGLNRLRDPWVRKGFAVNRPGYDPDDPA